MRTSTPFLKIVQLSAASNRVHGKCDLCGEIVWSGYRLDTHTHRALVCHSCFLLAASMFYSLSAYTDTVGTFKQGKEVK